MYSDKRFMIAYGRELLNIKRQYLQGIYIICRTNDDDISDNGCLLMHYDTDVQDLRLVRISSTRLYEWIDTTHIAHTLVIDGVDEL